MLVRVGVNHRQFEEEPGGGGRQITYRKGEWEKMKERASDTLLNGTQGRDGTGE